jgi:hypothetical protein
MMWFVEMRNHKESFPQAGIEGVGIEEDFLPSTTAIQRPLDLHHRASRVRFDQRCRGPGGHASRSPLDGARACLVQLD